MKWLVFIGSVFLVSCAGVQEIEMHSKQNVASIETLLRPSEVRKGARIEVKSEGLTPILKGSKWIRVWRGSYSDGRSVSPPGWMYIELEEEKPVTNF
ncbi:hypothetical protein [Hydrogenivirga sp.]